MTKYLYPCNRFKGKHVSLWKKIHKLNAEIKELNLQLKENIQKTYFINKGLEEIGNENN